MKSTGTTTTMSTTIVNRNDSSGSTISSLSAFSTLHDALANSMVLRIRPMRRA